MVGTWLEGDKGNSPSGMGAGLPQSDGLGMSFSRSGVESLAHDVVVVYENRANRRVGGRSALASPREFERSHHPATVVIRPLWVTIHCGILSELSTHTSVDFGSEYTDTVRLL